MSEKKTRRLAAIMFTDIAGYTRLMQESEARANQLRQRHREVFERYHGQFNGEILQYYGDGTLSIFDSCVDAVRCAIAMQRELQVEPAVPLRIGIHLGDIVKSESDIYGDGVNLAARVESLGVPYAVLISEDVRKQVKNQEIETVSMGLFEMKNVQKPLEVFAVQAEGLIVPELETMQGKAKRVEPRIRMRKWVRLAGLGLAAMLLSAVLFWAFGAGRSDGLLEESIREERVAAIPFELLTDNTNLETFSALCSYTLTDGLTEAGVKTCSQRTVQQYNHLIGVLPDNPEGKATFSEVTGARYIIEGTFQQEGDSLTVKSHLTDGWNGTVVRNFPAVKGHIQKKELLADQITRRIMGYWVAREVIDQGKFRPPLYEAYLEYMKIYELTGGVWGNSQLRRKHGRKAFEIDSTFYVAAFEEMFQEAIRKSTRFDTLIAILEPHYEDMTPFEQSVFKANIAYYERDFATYERLREEQFQMFPQDFAINTLYNYYLAAIANKPAKAWKVMNAIDWVNMSDELKSWRASRMNFLSMYGLMAGKYKEVIELADTYLKAESSPDFQGIYYLFKLAASVRSGQMDAIYDMLEEVRHIEKANHWWAPEYDLVNFCNETAHELLLLGEGEEALKFLNTALEWSAAKPERMNSLYDSLDLARTYRLLGQSEKALPLEIPYLERYLAMKDNFVTRSAYLSGIAIDYAFAGERQKAEEILYNEQLIGLFAARICAVLGEKEEAVEYLNRQQAYSPFWLKNDYFMQALLGYPPFEDYAQVRDEALSQ